LRESKLRLASLLLEKQRRIKENPLKYAQEHDKQKEASASTKSLRALFWGNRVGKTEWGAMETARILLGEHPTISPGDGWIFSPSFDEQKDTTQEKLLRYLPPSRVPEKNKTWLRKGILKELIVTGINGQPDTKVTFKSYEQGREKAQGAGKRFVWFDEEPPKDIFDECSVRSAAGEPLYLWMTMTPIKGLTWVYDSIYLNTRNPDIFVSTATWDDNPFLTEEQKAKMAGRLSQAELKVRREGKFMRQVGLVASWFDRSVHVMDMDEVPLGDIYMGLDFGFANPAACLWVSVDNQENVWVFGGFYGKGMTNPVILEKIRSKENLFELSGRVDRIGDSAQASDIREMSDAGLRIIGVEKEPGTKDENWDEYRAKLMEDLGRITEEKPHPSILISSDLIAYDDDGNPYNFLVKELENLRWEEVKRDGVVQPKSQWGKQPNHAIDALTYILATIERNRRRGSGGIVKAQKSNGIVETQIIPDARLIIESMKKANQRPVEVWKEYET
jgi:phage terminase large subunit-like protein